MRFVKKKNGIDNIVVEEESASINKRHGALLPNNIRALLIGPSGFGKTSAILNLILSPNGLHMDNLIIYSKSLHQSKYQILEKILHNSGVKYQSFGNSEDIITPENVENETIIVFDDISLEKQNPVKEFFALGRHKNVDSFYLVQSFSQVPKFLIRDNANLLLIFKQDHVNLRNIYRTHVNSDMSFDTFLKLCYMCWKEKYNFLMIDKDSTIEEGRYRSGFNVFILPNRNQSFWNNEEARKVALGY